MRPFWEEKARAAAVGIRWKGRARYSSLGVEARNNRASFTPDGKHVLDFSGAKKKHLDCTHPTVQARVSRSAPRTASHEWREEETTHFSKQCSTLLRGGGKNPVATCRPNLSVKPKSRNHKSNYEKR